MACRFRLRAMSIQPVTPALEATSQHRRTAYSTVLGGLSLLFALRVAAQAIQRWFPVAQLPPFTAFQGSALPYAALLPAQITIVATMLAVTRQVAVGALGPSTILSR